MINKGGRSRTIYKSKAMGGRRSWEGGFTIPELLAGICVSGACMFVLFGVLFASAGHFARLRERILTTTELLRADLRIRAGLGAVVIPYWERGTAVIQVLRDGEEIIIPWYGGIREHTLGFSAGGGRLVMETRDDRGTERSLLWDSAAAMTLIRDGNHLPRGLDFSLARHGTTFHIRAYFAVIPLAEGGGP